MKSSHDVVVSPSIKPILFHNQQQQDSWIFKPIKETNIDDVRFSCGLFVLLLFRDLKAQ
jgi:hypothetical protein